ncbi:MAG: c-type cytochrome [Bryobacteraceae bacterium]|nr:c-type cytochrome [Bryobacteraceae bacterium]
MWRLLLISTLALAQDGERIYTSQCAYCHGVKGEGGRGAPLDRATLRNAPDDAALARVIRRGIPDTGMPASALSEREIAAVSAHVRALGRGASRESAQGDARRGEAIYRAQKCAACHTIGGRGGGLGPDLGSIGRRRNAAHLRQSITDPEAEIAAGYFLIRAELLDRRAIDGVRVNEDSFSIQLRDAQGVVHSLWKSELRMLAKLMKKSLMPSYRALSSAQLDDLTAYLAALEEEGR